jgi:hypothetical protein
VAKHSDQRSYSSSIAERTRRNLGEVGSKTAANRENAELNERWPLSIHTILDRLLQNVPNYQRLKHNWIGLSTETDLKRQADERRERLAQAQAVELELRTAKRNLEEREKARDLEMAESWTMSGSDFSKKFQRGSKRNMRGKLRRRISGFQMP